MTINDKFFMAGTEKTGQYVVVLVTELGRVGFRKDTRIGPDGYRVRVEPFGNPPARVLTESLHPGIWKQPGDGGQHRFSSEVATESELESALDEALRGLLSGATAGEVNPEAPEWARELVKVIRKSMTGDATVEAGAQSVVYGGATCVAKVGDSVVVHSGGGSTVGSLAELLAEARALGIPGANSRWKPETLRRKIAEKKGAQS
jgi:hypothetical protein